MYQNSNYLVERGSKYPHNGSQIRLFLSNVGENSDIFPNPRTSHRSDSPDRKSSVHLKPLVLDKIDFKISVVTDCEK